MPLATCQSSSGLRKLAAEIKANHRKVQEGARTTLDAALAAGEALQKAKEQAGHGNWKRWLKESTGLSLRTAQQYMQLAKHRKQLEKAKGADDALFPISTAVQLITEPRSSQQSPKGQKSVEASEEEDGLDEVETVSRRGSYSNRDDDDGEEHASERKLDADEQDKGVEEREADDDDHHEVRQEVGLFERLTQQKPDKNDPARREFDNVYGSRETKMQREIEDWADSIAESLAEKFRQNQAAGTCKTSELKKAVLHRLGQAIARWEEAE